MVFNIPYSHTKHHVTFIYFILLIFINDICKGTNLTFTIRIYTFNIQTNFTAFVDDVLFCHHVGRCLCLCAWYVPRLLWKKKVERKPAKKKKNKKSRGDKFTSLVFHFYLLMANFSLIYRTNGILSIYLSTFCCCCCSKLQMLKTVKYFRGFHQQHRTMCKGGWHTNKNWRSETKINLRK